MSTRVSAALVLVTATCGYAEVVSYEAVLLPLEDGWSVQQNFCDPDEWVADGVFFQRVETCPGTDPEIGQQSSYIRSLDQFVGASHFFAEWRMRTSGDRSELPLGGPTSLNTFSNGPTNYHFDIADDQVEFNRNNLLIIFTNVEPGVFHTYLLEVDNTVPPGTYAFWIDDMLIDAGIADGVYPDPLNSRINFRAKKVFVDSLAERDYMRWGDTPVPGSGDFSGDGQFNEADRPFFVECLEAGGPGVAAWPGCVWADMDSDTDVDCDDWEAFKLEWDDPTPPPPQPGCDFAIPTASTWGLGVMALLLLTGGTVVFRHRLGPFSSQLGDPP